MAQPSNKEISDKLLGDPTVQAEIKKQGEDALSDPEVQAQLIQICKEKFPEYADAAYGAVSDWANDPEVQALAKKRAHDGLTAAAAAGQDLLRKVEQGPAGVRVLAFIGSAGACILATLDAVMLLNFLLHPIEYTISMYQLLFALSTMIFEMPVEYVELVEAKTSVVKISSYQNLLIENASFISRVGGRGLFYIFQGTLWLSLLSLSHIVHGVCGLYLCIIGILHLMLHFGVMTTAVVEKPGTPAAAGTYSKLPEADAEAGGKPNEAAPGASPGSKEVDLGSKKKKKGFGKK